MKTSILSAAIAASVLTTPILAAQEVPAPAAPSMRGTGGPQGGPRAAGSPQGDPRAMGGAQGYPSSTGGYQQGYPGMMGGVTGLAWDGRVAGLVAGHDGRFLGLAGHDGWSPMVISASEAHARTDCST